MTKPFKTSEVITVLNDVLTAELTAINQYFIHAELCQHWGLHVLYGKVRKESIDEMKHAEVIMERILFLDGLPNMQRLGKVSVGETVPEQFQLDLKLEEEAIARLKNGIRVCVEHNDPVSRMLLEDILKSEEEHYDWLQSQLDLIDQVGVQNYLATMIHPHS